jgi:hypothetical protein
MSETLAQAFVVALALYAGVGFVFAILFVSIGVSHLDAEARGAGLGFRLIILPGVAALWPLLFYRWARGITEPPIERNPHR